MAGTGIRGVKLNYGAGRREISEQERLMQQEIEQEAEKAEAEVRRQVGEVERGAQAGIATIREAEARQQRLQDLPFTVPIDIGASAQIVELEEISRSAQAEGRAIKEKIAEAKEINIEAVRQAADEARAELKKAKEKAVREVEKFEEANVKLGTFDGEVEYVSREEFEKLSKEEQSLLKKLGTEKYSKKIEKENVLLSTGEYFPKEAFDELDKERQKQLMRLGWDRYNKKFNIQINTGEMVDRELYNELGKEQKALLNRVGVAVFNKKMGMKQKLFEVEHVKLWAREGEEPGWVSKAEWEKLDNEQKALLLRLGVEGYNKKVEAEQKEFVALLPLKMREIVEREGIEAIDTTGLTGEQTFRKYQEWELLPKEAKYVGITEEGEIKYTALPEPFKLDKSLLYHFLSPFPIMRVPIPGKGYVTAPMPGMPSPPGVSLFYSMIFQPAVDLSTEAGLVAVGVKTIEEVRTAKQLKTFQSASTRAYGVEMAKMFVPGVWAVDWHKMTPTERAINIAIDAAILIPVIKASVSAIRAAKTPLSRSAGLLLKQEASSIDDTARFLHRRYGSTVAKNFKALGNAQDDYIRALVKLDTLQTVKRPNAVAIAKQKLKVTQLGYKLENTARVYTKSLGTMPGFDSPAVRKMINDLPGEVVRNAKSVVESLKPGKVNIKQLTADIVKAEARLAEYRAKFPTDPSKWTDLSLDLLVKQSKLAQAKAGGVMEMHIRLIQLRGRVLKLKGIQQVRTQAEIYKLEHELAGALKKAELEWAKGGMMTYGRGGVSVAVKPKVGVPRMIGGGTRIRPILPTEARTPFAVAALHLTANYEMSGAEITKIAPMVVETTKKAVAGETSPEVIKAMEQMVAHATMHALDLKIAGETATRIQEAIKELIESQIKAMPETKVQTKLQPKVKTMVKLALKTALQIKTKFGKKFPPVIRLPDGTTRAMTKKELAGAVAWKQGFIYKMIYPPYGEDNIVNTRKPIPGVKVVSGVRSAYISIVRLNGKIPAKIARDMGIMDIEITTPRRGKPRLRFRRDIRQRTRLTPAVGGIRHGG